MIKFIILIVAIYVGYKLLTNDFRKKKKEELKKEQEETARQVEAGEMVPDPECGAYVAIDSSISVKDGSKIYYFCSYECRDKFLKKLEAGRKK